MIFRQRQVIIVHVIMMRVKVIIAVLHLLLLSHNHEGKQCKPDQITNMLYFVYICPVSMTYVKVQL